jgi:hypothetical protein
MAISGNSSRASFFGSSLQQSQSFHAKLGSDFNPTPSDWYNRAKEGLAKFEDLSGRVVRIGDEAARKKIQNWMGSAIDEGTPANAAQEVLTDIRDDVELYIPANVNAYQVPSRTDKIQKLEKINHDLESMVVNAEAAHGSLPVGQGVVTPPPPPPSPGWILPIVVVASALGIAALVTYAYGGKA